MIYYYNGVDIVEIDNFVSIGLGPKSEISCELQEYLGLFDMHLYSTDGDYYLAAVLSYLQGYSLKNKLFNKGIGGVFYGIFTEKNFEWFSDTCYHIFDDNILESKMISVVSRNNNIYIHTDLDNCTKIFLNQLEGISIDEFISNETIKIQRLLTTQNPKFMIFYNKTQNHMILTRPDGWMYNNAFSRWIKRSDNKTDYSFIFSKHFVDFCNQKFEFSDGNPIISQYPIAPNKDYDLVNMVSNTDVVTHKKIDFDVDLDFSILPVDSLPIDFINQLVSMVSDYKNLIFLDLDFLTENLLEKIEADQHNIISLSDLSLEKLTYILPDKLNDFDEYLITILAGQKTDINDFSMEQWLLKHNNTCFIKNDGNKAKDEYLAGIALYLLYCYYSMESFFHLDKLILIADNPELQKILKIVPNFNLYSDNPDILLVRNINGFTNMDGRFKYSTIDQLIWSILNLSQEEIGTLETDLFNHLGKLD